VGFLIDFSFAGIPPASGHLPIPVAELTQAFSFDLFFCSDRRVSEKGKCMRWVFIMGNVAELKSAGRQTRTRGGNLIAVMTGLLLALILGGCGQSQAPCMAEGKVQFDGELVENGSLRFDLLGNEATVSGKGMISEGQYQIPLDQGMVAGEYLVSIYATRNTGRTVPARERMEGAPATVPEIVQYIPERYNTNSSLRVTLVEGENSKDFDLQSQSE
jgi:hypothetical protein